MNEIWKPLIGYEGLYEISNQGNLRSLKNGKILNMKLQNDKDGYKKTHVYDKNHVPKEIKIHREVAKAFIPNPKNLPLINHINEIKYDNRVENLEWCSCKDNNNHGTRNKRISATSLKNIHKYNPKKVSQFDKNGNFVKEYRSLHEAERETGIRRPNITSAIKRNSFAGGYIWKYS